MLRRLPSRGIPIGRLAAECCGDAHALDDGRPAGTLALSAVRALAGLPFAADVSADSRRAVWASVGVHLDELSSLVLCLGLPGDTRTALGRVLALHRETGQPAMLTLRQLRCHDEALSAGLVRICENPVVIAAAADEFGSRCPPLVCVGGQPSAAGWRLLDLLAAGGAEFRYHGDFDWGGIRIASAVRQRVSQGRSRWQPWRYDRDAYEAAATQRWPRMPPRGCPGWPASRLRPPGIRAWRPPWRTTMFASRRNSPSTLCSRTWPDPAVCWDAYGVATALTVSHAGGPATRLAAARPGPACRGGATRRRSHRGGSGAQAKPAQSGWSPRVRR